jgi:hypothetical protein
MPYQKGNKRPKACNYEKREAGNPGDMPLMRNQDVQNREELKLQFKLMKGWMSPLKVDPAFLKIVRNFNNF